MDDEPIFNPELYKKFRRRKKKFAGADWTPPSMSALPVDGVWCRKCKTRHGYMTLGFSIEHMPATDTKPTQNRMLWYCPRYKDVLEEVPLG
jgi:hypothetical protein